MEQEDEFRIQPNPASSSLNLLIDSFRDEMKVEIFDVLGKRIWHGLVTSRVTTIDIESWNAGIYLVKLSSDTDIQTKRLIKQ